MRWFCSKKCKAAWVDKARKLEGLKVLAWQFEARGGEIFFTLNCLRAEEMPIPLITSGLTTHFSSNLGTIEILSSDVFQGIIE